MTCPACGAHNPHFTVRCGKYDEPICDKHCNGCEYFSGRETSIEHCFYLDKLIERQKQEKLDSMLAEVLGK